MWERAGGRYVWQQVRACAVTSCAQQPHLLGSAAHPICSAAPTAGPCSSPHVHSSPTCWARRLTPCAQQPHLRGSSSWLSGSDSSRPSSCSTAPCLTSCARAAACAPAGTMNAHLPAGLRNGTDNSVRASKGRPYTSRAQCFSPTVHHTAPERSPSTSTTLPLREAHQQVPHCP